MNENDELCDPYTEAMTAEFQPFSKLARLNREVVITEKIDGSNAQIFIDETGKYIRAGSRNRWITPTDDNYGFARWVEENKTELFKLGPGRHFGEWWGNGIQRRYGLAEKRFSLFNVARWNCSPEGGVYQWKVPASTEIPEPPILVEGPKCCRVVPTLWRGQFREAPIPTVLDNLRYGGSIAAPGFMDAEGIVIYHTAANFCFKVTLKNDETPKSLVKLRAH
jgi:hypothetical protein